jgi:thiol-disulfide isomerase/thioredoxin
MKKLALILIAAAVFAGCNRERKVIIRGTFSAMNDSVVYLDRSDVDRSIMVDSAQIRRGHFIFRTEISGPEFFQVRLDRNDFINLLAMPGENITIILGPKPLVMHYEVSGSPGSEKIRDLDQHLFATRIRLDSIRKVYAGLTEEETRERGAELEQAYVAAVDSQRKYNIGFILKNINSMASVQALYQRIDDNTYVLYQPRDLQFLKIVSDSLSVKYPASRHVQALKENVTSEMNRMYIDRMVRIASEAPASTPDVVLPDTEGRMISLSSLRGKYVFVSFWATTSEDCLAELPALKAIYSQYRKKGLEIYQISLDADRERWNDVVRYEEIPWISVREEDPDKPVFAMIMNIKQIPSNLLYDPEGNLINTNLFGRNLQIRMDQLFNK